MGSQKLKQQAWVLYGSAPDALHLCYDYCLDVLVGFLLVGVCISLNLLPTFEKIFPPMGLLCTALIEGHWPQIIAFCFVLFGC